MTVETITDASSSLCLSPDQIVTLGAGVIALFLFFIGMVYVLIKVPPFLKSISNQVTITNEIIRNNSDFMREMTRSNDNMARALGMLEPILKNMSVILVEHDERAQHMYSEVLKTSERTISCALRSRREIAKEGEN